ncbi:hypothetical protein BST81_22470 [Leptolyngbya sp. 'hensonii']|uniref:hypothetical protein n=1 Tax=Leptolyngbya sp. 'hensonii' TaxID=1922337 RepID=UPI00094F8427|nr:hypothetical protein [Leptolyngbya sp. 'hensonii']OLP16211.1 hypothetical protein BST81_22470 [Leptolyngbya sp. 'hensonii']
MPKKTITLVITLLAAIVLLFGDFLPAPFSTISKNTRNTMNNFVAGLFPSWRPKSRPNERTEKALEQEQQQNTR